MRSRYILFLALVFVFQARGAYVSQRQAMSVARAWTHSGKVLGTSVDSRVYSARTISVTNDVVLHAVTMKDGRTVFVSGDLALEPVVAFSSAAPKEDGPLVDILRRDAYLRAMQVGLFSASSTTSGPKTMASKSLALAAAAGTATASAGSVVPAPDIARKWAALLPDDAASSSSAPSTALSVPNSYTEAEAATVLTDIRVSPLLKTRWSQETTKDGKACYNYYTPTGEAGSADNYPCGCMSTAISQIMRYHKYPDVLPFTSFVGYECYVDDAKQSLMPVADPDDETQPKPYDWDAMTYVPAFGASEESREAIGHLTYDVGVVLNSLYSEQETSAVPESVLPAFQAFGYPCGHEYYSRLGFEDYYYTLKLPTSENTLTGSEELRQKVILASLDARMPVLMGIYGFAKRYGIMTYNWGGHAVVADGYAMLDVEGEETTYVHVNLGWAGADDAWYNIPTIDTSSVGATAADSTGFAFQLLAAAGYNITSDSSCAGKELVTGRITDDDENGVSNAVVTVYGEDGLAIASTTSDEHGIYFFWLPSGSSYDIEAVSADGSRAGAVDDVIELGPSVPESDGIVKSAANVGNVWGADIELTYPCVRIGNVEYPSLDRALAAVTDNATVEIVRPAKFKAPFTLTHDITIVATNEDAYATVVTCRSGAMLTVEDGVSVTFTNVVFSSDGTVVDVHAGGKVYVSGVAEFDDLCSGVPGITTEQLSGFILAGELLNGLTLECAAAPDAGDQFGTYACGAAVAKACANRIISVSGEDRAGAWDSEITSGVGYLKWVDGSEIAPEVALISLEVGGEVTYYRTFDKLFDRAAGTNGLVEVAMLRSGAALTNKWTLTTDGEANWFVHSDSSCEVKMSAKAGLVLSPGVSLVCTNMAFSGPAMSAYSPFVVQSNAVFALSSGSSITGFSYAGDKHLVEVARGGRFSMSGAAISGCTMAAGSGKGTVHLDSGAVFDFIDSMISGCKVGNCGGAVYVSEGAEINISGAATAYGNTLTSSVATTNDVYLAKTTSVFRLAGPIGASMGIGVSGDGTVTKEGTVFGTADASLSEDDIFAAKHLVHNEANGDLYLEAEGENLKWTSVVPFPMPVDESDAVAMVSSGEDTNYYATLADAFRAVTNDNATITLVADAEFTESVGVLYDGLVLDGGTNSDLMVHHSLVRPYDGLARISVTNKTFTLRNIEICGGSGRVIDAYNANLVLSTNTVISQVVGYEYDMVAPVVVWGGTFTMETNVAFYACENKYHRTASGPLVAGAVSVSGDSEAGEATAYLNGGSVSMCSSWLAGGIYIGNGACVEIKGDVNIRGNTNATELAVAECNLLVNDKSSLRVVDRFFGAVGITGGVNSDTNKFGTTTLSLAAATNSAACFYRDSDRAGGLVAEDGETLVWGEAGSYSGGGSTPTVIVIEPLPIAFKSITKTDEGWSLVVTNRVPFCWYRLIWTEDLADGFTVTGEWEQAEIAGEWTTNVATEAEALFWKAEAKECEIVE